MANGYMGKMLWVDLSKGKLQEETLDGKMCRDFIGGYGLGARVLFSRMKAGVDPLGPDNILGIVTGPLTGTPALGGSRYIVVGKSPLTGCWGDANSGGHFGPHLKFAGYDAVFFTGISEKPVYLFIDNGKAELRDANHLWGKDTFETEDLLRSELGKDVDVACIGPSGEKVSLLASVMNNKGRAAARSGLGAVMGSKKLKAVAVKGNMKVPLADEKNATELRKKYIGEIGGPAPLLKQFGTPGLMVGCAMSGDAPVKNWSGVTEIDFPEVELISGEVVLKQQQKRYACYQCPIGCGGSMKEGTGEYKYEAVANKPEYETMAMFGSDCLNSNIESIIKANDICNRYGIDTISTGAAIAMTIECYTNGIITKEDTGGLEMTWGNHKAIVSMTEQIAKREGFGAILADGVKLAADKIGKGAEQYAMHIQGQEFPAHDPKFGFDWAICYRMDATPGRHTQGPGVVPPWVPRHQYDDKSQYGRQPGYKMGQCFSHVVQSLGLCLFVYWSLPNADCFIESIKAVTGWDITFDEIFKTGERIANIRHAFNIREGLNPLKFHMPARMAGKPPKEVGPLKGITLDEERMCKEYLTVMDWDLESAKPSRKKLEELGLEDVANVIWP